MSEIKLKPCLCGGKAELIRTNCWSAKDGKEKVLVRVECMRCGATGKSVAYDWVKAVEAWNRRVSDSEVAK